MRIRPPSVAAMLPAALVVGFGVTGGDSFAPTLPRTNIIAAAVSSSDERLPPTRPRGSSRQRPPLPSLAARGDDERDDPYVPPDLSGRVAVVTGATRGIGKGIALELGAAGCTVYVAGRSDEESSSGATSDRDFAGRESCTIQGTAREIDALPGPGRGIPVRCDVRDDGQVRALFERVREEHGGRLDVVVASAFQTPPGLNTADFRADFWRQGAEMWDCCHGVGLRGAYVTCCEAAPLMIDTAEAKNKDNGGSRPLMVLISSFGGKSYTFNVAYGVGKAGCDRLASDMSVQLALHGVDTVSLYPGIVRTEGNLAMADRGEWEEASGGMDLSPGKSESPRFSGRAVAALMADPSKMEGRSGKVAVAAELAKELGFCDVDGMNPPSIRSLKFILPGFVFPRVEKESGKPLPSWIKDNVPDYLLPWSVFEGGPPPTND